VATLSTPQTPAHPQLEAPAPLRLWHLTSLDAPTVAVLWTLAFAWSVRVQLPLWLPAVIGLAAWSFYIADRLLDARAASSPLRPRHHFHWRHRRVFLPLALLAGAAALALVLRYMPLAARTRNTAIAAAAMLYFTSVHVPQRAWQATRQPILQRIRRIPHPPKELIVGLLFTVVCALPAWTRMDANRVSLLVPALIFIALAWLNCHAIEVWESVHPLRNASISGQAALLAAAALVSAAIAAPHWSRMAALLGTAALSAVFLLILDRQRPRLAPTTLRAAADLVLLTPALLLFVR
jgi:hypothetical protein